VDGKVGSERRKPVGGARGRNQQRGVTLVEFALVAPVFFLLLLGMIDFGFTFSDYISLRNGVREGARQAVISPSGSATCTLDTAPADEATRNVACIIKDRIGIAEDAVRVAIVLRDGDDAGTTTGDVGDPVLVCAATPVVSTSGVTAPFLGGRTLTSETEMRIEVDPTFQNYAEGGLPCS